MSHGLVAAGLHARADGLTSLGVLLEAGGAALGWMWADPAVGLVITAAIAVAGWRAAREIGRRLMDAVDPALVDRAEDALRATPGVLGTGHVRLRWTGHQVRAECEIVVAPDITAARAHEITVDAEHALRHALPRRGRRARAVPAAEVTRRRRAGRLPPVSRRPRTGCTTSPRSPAERRRPGISTA
jgi:cation diffusion facilitator family transporter